MSGGAALAISLTLTAGLAGSIQAAVMGELGERVGIVPALAFSTLVAVGGGLAVLAVVERGTGGLRASLQEPAWLWSGGLLSLLIVLAITVSTPRIGVAATVGLVIAGNLVMAAAIDRYGLFGQDEIALGWPRLLGLALLAGGAMLSLGGR